MAKVLLIIVLALPGAVWAESQVGPATVIDGDTIKIYGVSHRLQQIDAPEINQTCRRDGVEWLCGSESARHLRSLIRSRDVYCEVSGVDRYGRKLSECFVGKRNLNAEMVASGYALAFRRYGDDYVSYEEHARSNKLGLWSGTFIEPWRYRRGSTETPSAPTGCAIKGNINRKGRRLYHRPSDSSYENTVVSPGKGERWFCSEEEAVAAGWSPAWPRP